MKKRILSILLVACMVLTLLPTAAFAAGIDYGDFTVTTADTAPSYANNTLTFGSAGTYTIEMKSGVTQTTTDIIAVNSAGVVNIVLSGVNIDVSGAASTCAFAVQGSSVVNLTLAAGTTNTLKSGINCAGLQVPNGATVTINGIGTLNATGAGTTGHGGAGIGGGDNCSGGVITINSGTINATGGNNSAGIGGGGKNGAAGGTITISGGIVTATNGNNGGGTGIGGGYNGGSGTIIINGNANVTAVASWEGAGIGSSNAAACGTVTIGGNAVVTATGGAGAGIGGGSYGVDGFTGAPCGNININDNATVTAASYSGGAGIGGGKMSGTGGTITIGSSATVIAVATGAKNAIDSASNTINGNILMANYSGTVAASTVTTVKNGWGAALATPITYTPAADYKSIAFTVPSAADYTLYQGASKQQGIKSSAASPTFIVGAGLNTFTSVSNEGSTYAATVTVNKDGSTWTGHGKSFGLYQGTTKKYNMTASGATATVSAAEGTYDIYDGTSDTGVNISVGSGGGNATVNYYTLTLSAGTGTSAPIGGGAYPAGISVPIDVAVNPGYVWSKWTSGNTALLADQAAKSTSIVMPASSVMLTSAATLDTYTISYQQNGGSLESGMTNPVTYHYTDSTITLNNPARAGYSFVGWSGTGLTGITNQTVTIAQNSTGAKSYTANWKADAPAAPDPSIVTGRTGTTITIAAQEGYEYSVDGGTHWYGGIAGSYTFTGLTPATAYNLACRKAEVTAPGSASAGSDASAALSVTTRNAAPAAPTASISSFVWDSVTMSAVTGGEYSKDAGATWQDGNAFTGLTAATKYSFAVRIKETADTEASAAATVDQYTAAATPMSGEGYTLDYSDETISITSGYEVSTSIDFSTLLATGDPFTPGTTYYVRKAKDTGTTPDTPASEAVSFTVSARPEAPSAGAHSYDYEDEQIIFGDDYEVFTTTSGGSPVSSDATTVTPGSTLYIRVKSTDSAPASDWTTITVPARPETTGLSISTSRTDTTITVTEITGAEYSKDGGMTWQSGNEFTGLSADTDYRITIRYAAASAAFASDALPSVIVRTKTSTGDAPSVPSVITQTDHAITIDAVAGYQYAITTSSTEPTSWGVAETTTGTKTFSSLSAATRYYIWVRVAETDTATPSGSSCISVYTAAAAPSGEGYTIDYNAETINYNDSIYEVTADTVALPLTIIENGDSITSNISDYNTAAQIIYVRIKAVTDGAPAGAWMEVTLPARPGTPSASASDETVDNKNDGRISGVTEAMEWKAAGGAYTAVTADQESNGISGLSDGTYYVRYMAASGAGFKSAEQEITIAAGHSIAVTFNSRSGSDVTSITGKAYGDSITAPAEPVRSGFYFAGWYKDALCTNPWTFTLDALTDDLTLFAKWSAIPAYTVTGRIVDDTSLAVDGATVRVMQGATQLGTTGITDPYGDFTINKVPPGIYNLVITKGTKTAIVKVEVSGGNVAIGNATLPSGNANSILVVTGSDTPNVVVGGLDSEAGTQLAGSGNPLADNIDITLTVEKKDAATAANGIEVTSAAAAAGKQVGIILSIDVRKTVNGTEDTFYNQTREMIDLNIPLPAEMQGKVTYAIYRYHGTGVDTITETPNDDLERIAIDRSNWIITLYANKFSTYAIGYTNHSSPRGGGGGTASAGTTAAAIVSQAAVTLPYYIANGKEIMIGFASDADGTMKYIAPKGVTVLFRENPKSFNDIAGHWAKKNIDFVTERELFLGTGDDKFSPQSGMTRAMFATVIGRLYERSYGELHQKDDNNFSDIDNDSYYAAYINWASENNIITGIGGGLFKPDREIIRQEMAAILYRFAEFLSVLPSGLEETQLHYPDAAGISSWATEAAGYCQQTGIITGRSGGDFVPQGTATRAEVAAILQRFIESSVK